MEKTAKENHMVDRGKTPKRNERAGATKKAKNTKAKKKTNSIAKAGKSEQRMALKAYKRELKTNANKPATLSGVREQRLTNKAQINRSFDNYARNMAKDH